eukprot:6212885-Pleurochrysis_carterae.AAC.1
MLKVFFHDKHDIDVRASACVCLETFQEDAVHPEYGLVTVDQVPLGYVEKRAACTHYGTGFARAYVIQRPTAKRSKDDACTLWKEVLVRLQHLNGNGILVLK